MLPNSEKHDIVSANGMNADAMEFIPIFSTKPLSSSSPTYNPQTSPQV